MEAPASPPRAKTEIGTVPVHDVFVPVLQNTTIDDASLLRLDDVGTRKNHEEPTTGKTRSKRLLAPRGGEGSRVLPCTTVWLPAVAAVSTLVAFGSGL